MSALKWTPGIRPTGQYRSFSRQAWPSAHVGKSGHMVAALVCDDTYCRRAMEKAEKPIRIFVYNYTDGPQKRTMRKLKKEVHSLAEAKDLVKEFFEAYPNWLPKEGT